jgi:hypothetical protein
MNGAVRLASMVWSQEAVVCSPSGGRRLTAAALTRMSGSPNRAVTSPAAAVSAARSAASVLTQPAVQREQTAEVIGNRRHGR